MSRQVTSKRQSAVQESDPVQQKADRSITIHPRVQMDESMLVKAAATQLNVPEMALWAESASDGLIITLIKHGPDDMGLYGGRWTAKELAQIARRRIASVLVDFLFEQDEPPALLKDYLTTLKTLAEKPSGVMIAGQMPMAAPEEPPTAEDEMVFSGGGASPEEVNDSLGGMGFGMLSGLNT